MNCTTLKTWNPTGTPAGNSGFKKLAAQWLNEVQFFNQTLMQAGSFVLRNRQLLKPADRCGQLFGQI